MKKFLTLLAVVALASAASATLKISVNGRVDIPESELWMIPSEHAVIDVVAAGEDADLPLILFSEGPGTLALTDNSWVVDLETVEEVLVDISLDPDAKAFLQDQGFSPGSMIYIEVAAPQVPAPLIPDGKMVDLVDFHCDGPGTVTLILFDSGTLEILDTQVIHQAPEPMTVALLGLGGLFLRRRK
jgi:hypothetical protein